jgi:hypothetical protein
MFAGLLAFVALVSTVIVLFLATTSASMCWAFSRGLRDPKLDLDGIEMPFYAGCVLIVLGMTGFVFLTACQRVRPAVVFRVRFFGGMLLLGYCLWLSCLSFPISNGPLLNDWTTQALCPAFLAPLTCLLLTPIGLLLLCYAIAYDPVKGA